MSQDPHNPSPAEAASPSPKPKRKWLRRIMLGLVVVVIVLLALVAFAPTIAGTGIARDIIVGRASKQLNGGSVKIDSTSFGWFSGQKIGGIKVYDDKQSLVLEIDRIETNLTLAAAARGNLDLGNTFIDLNLTRVQVDEAGNTNIQQLFQTPETQTKPGASAPDSSSAENAEVQIPNIKGKVTIKYRGMIEYVDELGGKPLSPPLVIEPGEAVVDIKDINAGIDNVIKLALRLGDKPAGSIHVAGKIDAVDGNKLNLGKLTADQSVKLAGIDIGALTPLLRLANFDGDLGGIVNGNLAVKADGLKSAALDGMITVDNASAAGLPQLQGDTLRIARIDVPIKVTRSVVDADSTQIKLESLRVEAPQFKVVLAGELIEQSLINVAAGQAPGADGWLSTTISVTDLADLLNQLPHAAKLVEGVKIDAGRFIHTADITLRKDKIFAKTRLDLDAAGTRDGKKIALAPVGVSFDTTYTPAVDPLKGLADMALVLTSDFAKASGGGKTIDKLDLSGDGDLGKLQAQLAQFIDLGGVDLKGTFNFALGSKGDLQKPNSAVAATAKLNLNGVNVQWPDQPAINIGAMSLAAESNLGTDDQGGIAKVTDARIAVTSGDTPQDKVLDLAATVNNVDLATSTVENFELTNLAISSLPKLVQQFGAFVPALKEQQIEIRDGQVYANVAGSYDGKSQTVTLSKPLALSTPNLTVTKAGATVLDREKIVTQILGTIGLAGGVSADLSQVSITSSIFTITKSEAPLKVKLDAGGAITGSGQLKLNADLARVGAAVQAFGQTPAKVQSGSFAATIDLAGGIGAESTVTLDGLIEKLTVAAAGQQAMSDEQLSIKATAKTSADLSALSATANIDSSFAKIALTKADVLLGTAAKPVGTYDMARALSADIAIPDLAKLYALATAFIPADTTIDQSKSGASAPDSFPVEPLSITSGAASLKVNLAREGAITKLNVSDVAISNLALTRGKQKYEFERKAPITLSLVADLDASGEQIRSVKITQLAGDLRVAQLSMPKPITITDVLISPKADGGVELIGEIANITPLLAVLQGAEELPYAGLFKVQQQLSNAGDSVNLVGGITIDNFMMRDAASGEMKLLEKQVAIKNDLSADLAKSNATIKSLTVDMPQTKAVSVKLVGGVNDWLEQRQIQDVKLDLTYDLSKLWPIIAPMLSPETQETLKGAKFVGAYTETFNVKGSFPNKPFPEAIKTLSADGQLRVDLADAAGLTIEKLTLPISLRDGKAVIAFADKPKDQRFPAPAICNGGTLNLNGFYVDLSSPDEPRLYGPKKHRVLQNVSINPALGNTIGKYVNPTFTNTERSQGLLDVTVERCDGVALIEKWQTSESGTARIALSITDLDIANPLGSLMFGKVAGALKLGNFSKGQTDTFKGEIRDAVITLENGKTTQDLTISLKEDVEATDPVTGKTITIPKNMPLSFRGDIRLSDLSQKLRVSLPAALVGRFIRVGEKDMNKFFPDGVPISLGGTTTKPEVDIGNIVGQLIEAQLRGAIGGKNGDPLGDLIDAIGGKKKDK